MAPSRKTWLWILVAVVGFGVICIVGLAGFGMYFVSNHVHAGRATTADAFKDFIAHNNLHQRIFDRLATLDVEARFFVIWQIGLGAAAT